MPLKETYNDAARTVASSLSGTLSRMLDTVGPGNRHDIASNHPSHFSNPSPNHQSDTSINNVHLQNPNTLQQASASPHTASASPTTHSLTAHFHLDHFSRNDRHSRQNNKDYQISEPVLDYKTSSSCAFLPTIDADDLSHAQIQQDQKHDNNPQRNPSTKSAASARSTPGFRQLVLSEKLAATRSNDAHRYPPLKSAPVVAPSQPYQNYNEKAQDMNISGSNLSESIYSMDNTYTPADNTHHNNSNNKKDGRNDCYYNGPPPVVLTSHKPYMGLGARLSQIWINPHTIFLILIIVKITSFVSTIDTLLNAAEQSTENNCGAAEKIASYALGSPHDLAYGATIMFEKGVHYGITGLLSLIYMLLQILQEVAYFVLSTMVGTYACLLTAAVDEVADVGLSVATDVIGFANATVNAVVDGLEDGLNAIEQAVESVTDVINSIHGVFNPDNNKTNDTWTIDNIDINISGLKNLTIPSSVTQSITDLKSKVPNYQQVKNETQNVISLPFNALFKEINSTISAQKISYNTSAVTLPPQPSVYFCSAASVNSQTGLTPLQVFFNVLHTIIHDILKVIVILLVIAAIIVCLPVAYKEIRAWLWIKDTAERALAEELATERISADQIERSYANAGYGTDSGYLDHHFNRFFNVQTNAPSARISKFMAAIIRGGQKWTARGQDFMAKRIGNPKGNGSGIGSGNAPGNPHKKVMARWWVEYVLYRPALIALFLGICGMFIVMFQFIIFFKVKGFYKLAILPDLSTNHQKSNLTFNSVFNSGLAADAIDDVENGIENWVLTANTEMHRVQDQVNEHLLGWVHDAAGSINDSLSVFSDTMNSAISDAFNGTVIYQGLNNIVYCAIGSKIIEVQTAISWLYNNTAISLPNVTAEMIFNSTANETTKLNSGISSDVATTDSNSTILTNTTLASSTLSQSDESDMDKLLDTAKSLLVSGLNFALNYIEGGILQELYISLGLISVWLFVAITGYIYCAIVVRRETEKSKAAAMSSYDGTSPGGPNEPKNRGFVGFMLGFLGVAGTIGKAGSKVFLGPLGPVASLAVGGITKVAGLVIVGIASLFREKKAHKEIAFKTGSDPSSSPRTRQKGVGPIFKLLQSKPQQDSHKFNKNGSYPEAPQPVAAKPLRRVSTIPGIGSFEYLNYQSDNRAAKKAKKPSMSRIPFKFSNPTTPTTPTTPVTPITDRLRTPPRPLQNPKVNQHAIPLHIITRRPSNAVSPSYAHDRAQTSSWVGVSADDPENTTDVPDFRSFPYPESLKKDTTSEKDKNDSFPQYFQHSKSNIRMSFDKDWHSPDCSYANSKSSSDYNAAFNTSSNCFCKSSVPALMITPTRSKDSSAVPSANENGVRTPMTPMIPSLPSLNRNFPNDSSTSLGSSSLHSSHFNIPIFEDDETDNQNRHPPPPPPYSEKEIRKRKREMEEHRQNQLISPARSRAVQDIPPAISTRLPNILNSSTYSHPSSPAHPKPAHIKHLNSSAVTRFNKKRMTLDSPILGATPHSLFGALSHTTNPFQTSDETPHLFGDSVGSGANAGPSSRVLYGNLTLNNASQGPYYRSPLSPVTPGITIPQIYAATKESPANPFDSFYEIHPEEEQYSHPSTPKKIKHSDDSNNGEIVVGDDNEEDLVMINRPSTPVDTKFTPREETPRSVRSNRRPSLQTSPGQQRKSQHVTVCFSPT